MELAHRLGLKVTAECVESAEQARRLRRIGCDTGQGWFYSRPVTPELISALVGSEGHAADASLPEQTGRAAEEGHPDTGS